MPPKTKINPFVVDQVLASSSEIPQGLRVINTSEVWKYTKGEGVVVAIIDTGCNIDHPDLKDSKIDGINLYPTRDKPREVYTDGLGHGTHVAGTIAARENDMGVVGIAPECKLLIIKAFPDSGIGFFLPIPEAVEYAIRWKGPNGERVRVINMSLSTGDSPELHSVIKKAVEAGIVVVAAAGNDGDSNPNTDELGYPGAYDEVVEVGAFDFYGNPTSFTNSNSQIDLVAPGKSVLSTYLGTSYATLSGTSMATPHVTGAVALLISGLEKAYKRKLSEPEIFTHLIKRTRALGHDKRLEGHGILDLSIALEDFEIEGEVMELRNHDIDYLDIHHTAAHEANAEEVRRYHMDVRGYGDIGYNAVIEKDGTVGEGRDIKWAGAHDPGVPFDGDVSMNRSAYAISCIGNFEVDTMEDIQFNSLVKKATLACKEFDIPVEKVRRHKDQYATSCPGKNFPWDRFISELSKNLKEEVQMEHAVMYFTVRDFSIADVVSEKLGGCATFNRRGNNANIHPDARNAKHLVVIGGAEVTDHANVTNLCGLHAPETAIKAAQYAQKL